MALFAGQNAGNRQNDMARRYASTRTGTGKNDYGYTSRVGNYIQQPKKKSTFNFPMGGLVAEVVEDHHLHKKILNIKKN